MSRYWQRRLISLFCADVTATQAALITGLNRNTVNRYFRLFREAIHSHQTGLRAQLCGTVEVDESYFGPSRVRGKAGRGRGLGRQPVFGIIERGGRVFTEIVPDVKKKTLQALIRGHAAPETVIVSDGFRSYDGLVDVGYDKHLRLNKYYERDRPRFAENGVHINGIESFWSFTKRRLAKFNGTVMLFELHLKECEWRWAKDYHTLVKELILLV